MQYQCHAHLGCLIRYAKKNCILVGLRIELRICWNVVLELWAVNKLFSKRFSCTHTLLPSISRYLCCILFRAKTVKFNETCLDMLSTSAKRDIEWHTGYLHYNENYGNAHAMVSISYEIEIVIMMLYIMLIVLCIYNELVVCVCNFVIELIDTFKIRTKH